MKLNGVQETQTTFREYHFRLKEIFGRGRLLLKRMIFEDEHFVSEINEDQSGLVERLFGDQREITGRLQRDYWKSI